jgi:hypothetical protein
MSTSSFTLQHNLIFQDMLKANHEGNLGLGKFIIRSFCQGRNIL